ncbi:PREDICTED: sciellin [Chaetura pelagica]|uniref:sciellin n=1 Tax=Chaetura pelagica TaxID=8897 RepID=UPI00052369A6|nr:PREDICTED: sciellin [Chaetura pelagica]
MVLYTIPPQEEDETVWVKLHFVRLKQPHHRLRNWQGMCPLFKQLQDNMQESQSQNLLQSRGQEIQMKRFPQKDTPLNKMSAFSRRKQSPNQSDNKSPSVAIKGRQQATHDVNKRRTLLQDNSWIKKRPEEESADENYGRAVLNQYKSQDGLHRSSTNEKEDQKAVLGRYRSDTTLDRQSWTPNASSTNTAATSPIKKKRQSWMPPPVSSSTTTTETVDNKQAAFSSEQVTPQKSKTDEKDQATSRDEDLGDHTEVKSADDQSKKRVTEQACENPPRTPNNLPETNYSSDSERKTSKSSYGAYEENLTGNTIKTVYSTSDRSIIGKDICTYCRKPLGIDAKMILDALQICCHSTCFKCEVCKRPLEDLKAGDSIWIYRQTVHCEPCYSKVKEEPKRKGAMLDLVPTKKDGLVDNVKLKGSLDCSEHEMLEFRIRRATREVHSKLTTFRRLQDFRRADFSLFRDLIVLKELIIEQLFSILEDVHTLLYTCRMDKWDLNPERLIEPSLLGPRRTGMAGGMMKVLYWSDDPLQERSQVLCKLHTTWKRGSGKQIWI